jgi:spore maturation protein SpmB
MEMKRPFAGPGEPPGLPEKTAPAGFGERIQTVCAGTLRPALSVIRFLLVIMLPVSFAVLVLEVSGVLHYVSRLVDPVMRFAGLPGEAALAFISSVCINIYSAIAVIKTLTLTGKQLIILASMCLIAHSFVVECVVMKKTGSSLWRMVFLRLAGAFAAAWVLNRFVPPGAGMAVYPAGGSVYRTGISIDLPLLAALLVPWLTSSLVMVLQVFVIVFAVMFGQRLFSEFGVMKKLARLTAPLLAVFGLPSGAGYAWLITTVVGVAYGAGVLIAEVNEGGLTKSDADLLNHHAAMSHSQVEDTLLMVSIGTPYLWAALPRLALAVIFVWLERLRRFIFRRSFRVKVM